MSPLYWTGQLQSDQSLYTDQRPIWRESLISPVLIRMEVTITVCDTVGRARSCTTITADTYRQVTLGKVVISLSTDILCSPLHISSIPNWPLQFLKVALWQWQLSKNEVWGIPHSVLSVLFEIITGSVAASWREAVHSSSKERGRSRGGDIFWWPMHKELLSLKDASRLCFRACKCSE